MKNGFQQIAMAKIEDLTGSSLYCGGWLEYLSSICCIVNDADSLLVFITRVILVLSLLGAVNERQKC